MSITIAIIGGTGTNNQALAPVEKEKTIDTRYGPVTMKTGELANRKLYFLARHGGDHLLPPHRINYRANIAALKKLGVTAVIATAAVGTMRQNMPPGEMVVIDQFIDFTKQRPLTFYDGLDGPVTHIDFTEPYCPEVRKTIISSAKAVNQNVVDGGCYVCTEGPRFETPAEIRMFEQWGGDLVGMTNVPEVVLAREAGLCYATIALPTNYAAGISANPLTHEEVLEEMDRYSAKLNQLLAACVKNMPEHRSCYCKESGNNYHFGES